MCGADVAKIRWLPDYTIGVDQIDQEHRQLFALAAKLDSAIQSGHEKEVLGGISEDLVALTGDHFAHEEQLMDAIGYPYAREHHAQHEEIRQKIQSQVQKVGEDEHIRSLRLLELLIQWLKCHTTTTDRRLGNYIQKHGLAD
ncbi:MAG TPA: bacteriohemerythrin [Bryobacteraceae bacterium]